MRVLWTARGLAETAAAGWTAAAQARSFDPRDLSGDEQTYRIPAEETSFQGLVGTGKVVE